MSRNKTKDLYIQSLIDSNAPIEKEKELIKFNFSYYRYGEEQGESFEQWQIDCILADLNNKLKFCSEKTKVELINDNTLEIFSNYPTDSKFEYPKDIIGKNMSWARIRLTGKRRLIGFFRTNCDIEQNVFFVVFLDKDHQFAPSKKKHT